MALFGKKKTEETKEVKEVEVVAKKATKKTVKKTLEGAPVIKEDSAKATSPKGKYSYRITEKATRLSEKNVYVLNVPKEINKTELKKDLEAKYKVTVLKINVVNTGKKTIISRGRYGTRGGGKKAYITLAAGQSIVL